MAGKWLTVRNEGTLSLSQKITVSVSPSVLAPPSAIAGKDEYEVLRSKSHHRRHMHAWQMIHVQRQIKWGVWLVVTPDPHAKNSLGTLVALLMCLLFSRELYLNNLLNNYVFIRFWRSSVSQKKTMNVDPHLWLPIKLPLVLKRVIMHYIVQQEHAQNKQCFLNNICTLSK